MRLWALRRALQSGRLRVEEAAEAVRLAVEQAERDRAKLRSALSWRTAGIGGAGRAATRAAEQESAPFLGGRAADPWVSGAA